MDLNRDLADPQFTCNLLVEQAGCNETHHVFLARSELLETSAQFGDLQLLLPRVPVTGQPLLNRIEKVLIAKRVW